MAKLKLKQKEWFTLKEAAQYLNRLSQDDCQTISEIDIIQYALSGDLTLSLRTFSSVPGVFGYFFPRDSRPPQPETEPPEHEGPIVYLGNLSPDISLIEDYELRKALSNKDPNYDGAVWEGPAIAIIDDDANLPPATWDIFRDPSAKEYLTRHLQSCLKDNKEISTLRDFSGGDWSVLDTDDGSGEGTYEFCLITADKSGAALVRLCDVLKDSAFCVRPQNLNALFEGEPAETTISYARPKTKLEAQKEAVLGTLRAQLDLDPQHLPQRKDGPHRGAKAQCWDILKSNRELFTEDSFKAAWKELRKTGEIMGG